MPEPEDVVVIGGGIAGLTAAVHLAESGLRVTVLEADPNFAGGRLSAREGIDIEGWSFPGEHGVHGIWSGYINFQAMLVRHRIRPMLVPAQEEDWHYRQGNSIKKAAIGSAIRESWIPAPFHYLNLFLRPSFLASLKVGDWASLFGVWAGLLFALGIDPLREDQPLAGKTMHDVVGKWSTALRSLFIGLARNGFAGQPEEIPLSGFLAFLRFYTVLRRDAWAFSYLPGDGGSRVIDPLVERLQSLGGRLVLNARVVDLKSEGKWQVVLADSRRFDAAQVIVAVDARAAEALFKTAGATSEAARDLFFPGASDTAIARLWFDRKPRFTAEAGMLCGDFIFDNFFWLDRIYTPYIHWSKKTGGSAIELHLYGPPAVIKEQDAVLLARAVNETQAIFPELRGHRKMALLQRNTTAHTLFGLGPAHSHLGIRTPWPNLFCCGDWVRHPEPALFIERACVTGIAAANAVLTSFGLPEWPVLLYPPPEPLAAWIQNLMVSGRARIRRGKQ